MRRTLPDRLELEIPINETAVTPEVPSSGDPCETNNGDCDHATTCTNEDGAAVCGLGTIGCFECHVDEDCPDAWCVANECADE
jgi:hypothetical protein